MQEPLHLRGCRHDILGHYLKAIGLLRVLAKCAAPEHRDPDAEGWWDTSKACFCLRSPKYPTREALVEFFALHYRPTPVFAAWNKKSGSDADASGKLGVRADWEVANRFSVQVVSAEDRKKPANRARLVAVEALAAYRDAATSSVTEAVDSIVAPFLKSNTEHPLFLSKGIAGRAHLWRTHWEYLATFQKLRSAYEEAVETVTAHKGTAKQLAKLKEKADAALLPIAQLLPFEGHGASSAKGKGTPFFPDAIKAYNIGSGWVTENYPFNALDYVLAVEGGFAMRGSVGRTLAANSRRFAAFPFVFDAGEDLVDDANEVKGTSSALWFPLWDRPVTFAELSSFITDAQARLPGKEARFSAEFMRALHSQGVDAGFTGWQEFRFKMKVSRVPWITTGAYVEAAFREDATRLNRALHPLDEAGFVEQFAWDPLRRSSRSPHRVAQELNAAMETASRETTPHHCLDLLGAVFCACRQMAISKSFPKTLPDKRARFFQPLPMEHWNHLLREMDQPEFRIARAVASMRGRMKQTDGTLSEVLPMLGSLLPLKLERWGWHLPVPPKEKPSKQAVWTGTDVCHDLAAVLGRRYMHSLTDERPALVSSFGAPLEDVLAFLRRELDDQLIARWIEALSLIGWKLVEVENEPADGDWEPPAIPPEYAALRTLIELECDHWKEGDTKKRRSQQPVSLLCQRSASTLPLAVMEALRWIAIWGFDNPYGKKAAAEKARLAGRDIISLPPTAKLSFTTDAARLAAAVCIPLHWRDKGELFQAVSLPQGKPKLQHNTSTQIL